MSTEDHKENYCNICNSYSTHRNNLHILQKWQSIPFSNIDLPIQRICINCQDYGYRNYGWSNISNKQPRYVDNAYGKQISWNKIKRRSQSFIQRSVNNSPCIKRFAQYYIKSDTLNTKEREKKQMNKILSNPFVLNRNRPYNLQDISHIRNNVEQEWYRRSIALTKKHKLFINFLQQHYCNGVLRRPSSISKFPKQWFKDLHTLYYQVGYEPMKYFYFNNALQSNQQKKRDIFLTPNYNWLLSLQRMANCKEIDKLLQLGRLGRAALDSKFSPQKLTELIVNNTIHTYFPLTIEEYNFYQKYFEQNPVVDDNTYSNVNNANPPVDKYNTNQNILV